MTELNEKTKTETEPLEFWEEGPYATRECAKDTAMKPSGFMMITIYKKRDGWYAVAARGYNTSTVTSTYYEGEGRFVIE